MPVSFLKDTKDTPPWESHRHSNQCITYLLGLLNMVRQVHTYWSFLTERAGGVFLLLGYLLNIFLPVYPAFCIRTLMSEAIARIFMLIKIKIDLPNVSRVVSEQLIWSTHNV